MCGHSSILHLFDNSYSSIPLFGCVEDKLTDREMTRVRKVISSRDWFTGYSYYLVIVLLRWDAIVVCVKLGQCVTGRGYIELVVLLCSNVKIVSCLGKLRCVIFLVAWSIICDIYIRYGREMTLIWDTTISQISHYIGQISQNAPFHSRNVHVTK